MLGPGGRDSGHGQLSGLDVGPIPILPLAALVAVVAAPIALGAEGGEHLRRREPQADPQHATTDLNDLKCMLQIGSRHRNPAREKSWPRSTTLVVASAKRNHRLPPVSNCKLHAGDAKEPVLQLKYVKMLASGHVKEPRSILDPRSSGCSLGTLKRVRRCIGLHHAKELPRGRAQELIQHGRQLGMPLGHELILSSCHRRPLL